MDYIAPGRRIRAARKARGMTQAEFAKAIRRSLPFYGHIERGTRKMSIETFCKIAKALNASADELLGPRKDQRVKEARARELLEIAPEIAKTIEDSDPNEQRFLPRLACRFAPFVLYFLRRNSR